MRLLFLSNFYPPASRGGFEQWCQEVALGLAEHGHEITVLTSDYGSSGARDPGRVSVHRDLHLEMEIDSLKNVPRFFINRKTYEKRNLFRLEALIQRIEPDAVLIWGMWNIQRSVPALAERLLPGRAVYYMGDYWPTLPSQFQNYWDAPARGLVAGLAKRLLKPIARSMMAHETQPALLLDHVIFPSAFMQAEFYRKGFYPKRTKIIYGAIDTSPYLNHHAASQQTDIISLLHIGRVTHEKGVHLAIKALSHIVKGHGLRNVNLTIVGGGDVDYVEYLHQLVKQEEVADYVSFLPAQPKEALPLLYSQADIFLFTSIWPEPFGRVIVEAMASGLAVIGSPVGGAAEILMENALLFSPDDADGLAQQLKLLIESPALRRELGCKGRESVLRRFNLQRMTIEIEEYLRTIAN